MRRKMSQISGVVALSVVTLAVTTDVSAAQISSSHLSRFQGQLVLRLRNAGGNVPIESVTPSAVAIPVVVCDSSPENPHYSRGAGSVILKTRITCRGDGIQVVQIRVIGHLGLIFGPPPPGRPPSGPPASRATSDETQNITVNGPAKTYYTPLEGPGTPKVRGSGWYQGDVTGEIVAPPPGTITNGPIHGSSNRF
jgi:hypothetical protein